MATAEQVKALLKSYSEGNGEHFVSVALQIAAQFARTGKGKLAQDLRDIVDDIKRKQATGKVGGAVPIVRPTGELAGLLAVTYPKTRLSEMVLSPETSVALDRTIREYRQQEKLRQHGLSARRKLLLIGPPGSGKTMTASALAGELKLPLFSVQLHGLITKFMGETAAKLYMIFDAMTQTRGVYFFDEFDAIGADRGAKNDVGEIRRVLNSFLQFLEQDDSDSIILAATNYVEMLDEALFRRFDDVVRYSRPRARQIDQLIQNRLQAFLVKRPAWAKLRDAATGLSHAEIARACDDAAKDHILQGKQRIGTAALVAILTERRRPREPSACEKCGGNE
ncbi:MAG TPA: ATP-binding protein [Planctomycetaceae bacterium]|jgi:SpoVK/Ycf46/Vps4 family AAA+-type ATPase|nr:ATP-binding protein [Planctomycetaceae bacterium]